MPQLLGTYRRDVQWVATATGAFACAFPGFILGYFLMPSGRDLGAAYACVVGGAVASLLIVAALSYTFRVPSTRALPLLAGLAAALYLWFAARGAVASVGLDEQPWLVLVRVVCLFAVFLWWWRARQARPAERRAALPLLNRE
jgi:Ca2+/Na+ antiporter